MGLGSIIASHAFNRWMVRCMALCRPARADLAGYPGPEPRVPSRPQAGRHLLHAQCRRHAPGELLAQELERLGVVRGIQDRQGISIPPPTKAPRRSGAMPPGARAMPGQAPIASAPPRTRPAHQLANAPARFPAQHDQSRARHATSRDSTLSGSTPCRPLLSVRGVSVDFNTDNGVFRGREPDFDVRPGRTLAIVVRVRLASVGHVHGPSC